MKNTMLLNKIYCNVIESIDTETYENISSNLGEKEKLIILSKANEDVVYIIPKFNRYSEEIINISNQLKEKIYEEYTKLCEINECKKDKDYLFKLCVELTNKRFNIINTILDSIHTNLIRRSDEYILQDKVIEFTFRSKDKEENITLNSEKELENLIIKLGKKNLLSEKYEITKASLSYICEDLYADTDRVNTRTSEIKHKKVIEEINKFIQKDIFINETYPKYILQKISENLTNIDNFCITYCSECRKNQIYHLGLLEYDNKIERNHNKKYGASYRSIEPKNLVCNKCNAEIKQFKMDSHIQLNSFDIFDDRKEQGKFKISILSTLYVCTDNSIYPRQEDYKLIYDFNKQRTFFTRKGYKKNGFIITLNNFNESHLYQNMRIMLNFIDKDKMQEMIEKIYEAFKEELNINLSLDEIIDVAKIKTGKCIINDDKINNFINVLNIFAVINSYRHINITKEFLLELEYQLANNKVVSYTKSKYLENGDYFKNTLKTSKAARKIIFNRPWKIVTYLLFKDCFSKNDNELKILNNINIEEYMLNALYFEIYGYQQNKSSLGSIDNCKKYNEVIKKQINRLNQVYANENILANKLIKNKTEFKHCFFDSILMMNNLNDEQWNECVEMLNKKVSLKNIHDTLSVMKKKAKNKNMVIPYEEINYTLEKDIKDYKIRLAKDTHELITIGSLMGICVGSYGNRAVNKYCTIVYIKQYNEYKCCIELRKGSIIQAKTKYNKLPEGELKKVILQWANESNLKINTHDLNNDVDDYFALDQYNVAY